MIKLVRKWLATEKTLIDDKGRNIEWKYFESLEKYRVNRNVVTHKLTKKHILWEKNKMAVNLVVELFSKSVADSIDYLRDHNCADFANSEATVEFVRIMNDLFDVFNTIKIGSSNQFKNAINPDNYEAVFQFLDHASNYIKSIKIGNTSIFKTNKATGFKGYLVNIFNIKRVFEMYVATGIVDYLPTYQMSQDPLESLFSRVRRLNGN